MVALTIGWLVTAQFQGAFESSDRVTVLTDRAGLLLLPGSKVRMHGAQIGSVSEVTPLADGRAEVQLAIEPGRLRLVPDNIAIDIAPSTVFGAKAVEFIVPESPSRGRLTPGQVLTSDRVTVETNTVFDQINSLMSHIDPTELHETLNAMSTAFVGRGDVLGQAMVDVNRFLGDIEPGYSALTNDLDAFPAVAGAYADAAPNLVRILQNSTSISRTLVDQQTNLDRFLVANVGLADEGHEVFDPNADPLAYAMRLLVPTGALLNEYREGLNCSLTGILPYALKPPGPNPGVTDLAAFSLGLERYRYPQDLPKVAATGGPFCDGQIPIRFNEFPAHYIFDVGTNPHRYGNSGPLLNSDLLKQILFGPIDGPPRNSAQIGQPG